MEAITTMQRIVKLGVENYMVEQGLVGDSSDGRMRFSITRQSDGKTVFSRTIKLKKSGYSGVVFTDDNRGLFIAYDIKALPTGESKIISQIIGIYSVPHGFTFLAVYDNIKGYERVYPSFFNLIFEAENNPNFDFNTFVLEEIRKSQHDIMPKDIELIRTSLMSLAFKENVENTELFKQFVANSLVPNTVIQFSDEFGKLLDSLSSGITHIRKVKEFDITREELEQFKEILSARVEQEIGGAVVANYLTQFGKLYGGLIVLRKDNNFASFAYVLSPNTLKNDLDELIDKATKAFDELLRKQKKSDIRGFSIFIGESIAGEEAEQIVSLMDNLMDRHSRGIDLFLEALSTTSRMLEEFENISKFF